MNRLLCEFRPSDDQYKFLQYTDLSRKSVPQDGSHSNMRQLAIVYAKLLDI